MRRSATGKVRPLSRQHAARRWAVSHTPSLVSKRRIVARSSTNIFVVFTLPYSSKMRIYQSASRIPIRGRVADHQTDPHFGSRMAEPRARPVGAFVTRRMGGGQLLRNRPHHGTSRHSQIRVDLTFGWLGRFCVGLVGSTAVRDPALGAYRDLQRDRLWRRGWWWQWGGRRSAPLQLRLCLRFSRRPVDLGSCLQRLDRVIPRSGKSESNEL